MPGKAFGVGIVCAGIALTASQALAEFASAPVRVGRMTIAVGQAAQPSPPAETRRVDPEADTELYQHSPAKNLGSNRRLDVISRAGWNARALLRFNLAGTVPGSTITACTLHLFLSEPASTGSRTHGVFRLTDHADTWVEGEHGFSATSPTGSSWLWYARPNSWDTLGGDMAAAPTATAMTGTTKRVWLSWDLTPDCQAGSSTLSWVVRDMAENNPDYPARAEYQSRESFDGDTRPYVLVTYQVPN